MLKKKDIQGSADDGAFGADRTGLNFRPFFDIYWQQQ